MSGPLWSPPWFPFVFLLSYLLSRVRRNFMHCELVAAATWSDVLSFESVKWHDEKHEHKYSTLEVLTDDPQKLTSEAEASSQNSSEKSGRRWNRGTQTPLQNDLFSQTTREGRTTNQDGHEAVSTPNSLAKTLACILN